MMSASLLALARLAYEYRGREALIPTLVALSRTVLALLEHRAQEVIRAAVVYVKVLPAR